MKILDTLTAKITLDQFGNLEILPRIKTCPSVGLVRYEDASQPIRFGSDVVEKLKALLNDPKP